MPESAITKKAETVTHEREPAQIGNPLTEGKPQSRKALYIAERQRAGKSGMSPVPQRENRSEDDIIVLYRNKGAYNENAK